MPSDEMSSQDYSDCAGKGSVYLITSSGQTVELPIPSELPNDPLRWSWIKRVGALSAIYVFTIVNLVLVQGTSMLLQALEVEYKGAVYDHRSLDGESHLTRYSVLIHFESIICHPLRV
jgi:hypothetical protein